MEHNQASSLLGIQIDGVGEIVRDGVKPTR